MTSYFNNAYDVTNCFAKFEKFVPYSITMPSFVTVGGQIAELDPGASPYSLGSQDTPHSLGLNFVTVLHTSS